MLIMLHRKNCINNQHTVFVFNDQLIFSFYLPIELKKNIFIVYRFSDLCSNCI